MLKITAKDQMEKDYIIYHAVLSNRTIETGDKILGSIFMLHVVDMEERDPDIIRVTNGTFRPGRHTFVVYNETTGEWIHQSHAALAKRGAFNVSTSNLGIDPLQNDRATFIDLGAAERYVQTLGGNNNSLQDAYDRAMKVI